MECATTDRQRQSITRLNGGFAWQAGDVCIAGQHEMGDRLVAQVLDHIDVTVATAASASMAPCRLGGSAAARLATPQSENPPVARRARRNHQGCVRLTTFTRPIGAWPFNTIRREPEHACLHRAGQKIHRRAADE